MRVSKTNMHVGNRKKTQIRSSLDSSRHLSTFCLFIYLYLWAPYQYLLLKHNKHLPQMSILSGDSISKYLWELWSSVCERGFKGLWWAREDAFMVAIQKFVVRLCRPVGDEMPNVCHAFFEDMMVTALKVWFVCEDFLVKTLHSLHSHRNYIFWCL